MKIIELLEKGAVHAAPRLIGCRIYVREKDGSETGGIIIETEAYTQEDAASHSYRGRTMRTDVMFGAAGHVYVYFTYGMHWCMNIVTGHEGYGEGVLIRAVKPQKGLEIIKQRRKYRSDHELMNGPAKVCEALGVTGVDNGALVNSSRFILLPPRSNEMLQVQATERIGIKRDTHRLWRFIAV